MTQKQKAKIISNFMASQEGINLDLKLSIQRLMIIGMKARNLSYKDIDEELKRPKGSTSKIFSNPIDTDFRSLSNVLFVLGIRAHIVGVNQ